MKRDTSRLSKKTFDLLIIGGGIYGASIAWDAASRGLSVALVDKGDFGGATSSNSQKIIHGGLRYIQHGDLRRVRESAHERRILMHIAPHLVHPMPCLIPIYGSFMQSVMPIALKIYNFASFDQNTFEDPQKHILSGRTVSKGECLNLIPGIKEDGLRGGAIWYDGQVYNTERMVLSFIKSANNAGAEVANYIEVIDLLKDGNRIKGAKAKDVQNGAQIEIRANLVLNVAGPWINQILGKVKTSHGQKILLSKMLLLVVNRIFAHDYAFGIPSLKKSSNMDNVAHKKSRLLFVTPWRNHSLIGTAQEPYNGDPDSLKIKEKDILGFIEEFNKAYPQAVLMRKEVTFFYAGLVPMDGISHDGNVRVTSHYKLYDHEKDGIEGFVSIVGVKYTTARDVAQKSTDLIFKKLGKTTPKCTTMETRLCGGLIERFNEFLENAIKSRPQEISEQTMRHLVYNYGSEYPEVLNYSGEDFRQKITSSLHVIKAQILYGIKDEMAQKLSDVILRRTELGTAGYPGDECIKTCASIMAKELGWNESRIHSEIEEVKALYTP